ncbi:MAG: hybrid sensor histidine kinase/response regulator [Cyanobacteria bacterium P01_H01_bin.15]
MAVNSDDQTYQFFADEAPELLEAIETGLLTVRQDRSTPHVHSLMRAAHSLKGNAANVGLTTIKELAHRLEDVFKGLYSEEVIVDTELEGLLLQAFDCLRSPLTAQLEIGSFDETAAMAQADPVFAELQARLGSAMEASSNFIPSSGDLGIDLVSSIFEVDVEQGICRIEAVLAASDNTALTNEVQTQAEVFAGFGEMLGLKGFEQIAQHTLAALAQQPAAVATIARVFIEDASAARLAVLSGDRASGGTVSTALANLAKAEVLSDIANELLGDPGETLSFDEFLADSEALGTLDIAENELDWEVQSDGFAALGDIFGEIPEIADLATNEPPQTAEVEASPEELIGEDSWTREESAVAAESDPSEIPALEDIFGGGFPEADLPPKLPAEFPSAEDPTLDEQPAINELAEEQDSLPEIAIADSDLAALADVFGSFSEADAAESSEIIELSHEETAGLVDNLSAFAEVETPEIEDRPTDDAIEQKLADAISKVWEGGEVTEQLELSSPEITLPVAIAQVSKHITDLPTLAELATATIPAPARKKSPILTTPKETVSPAALPARQTLRVDVERLERIDNLIGELAINRNRLSLQNSQLQSSLGEMLLRFNKFQGIARRLQSFSGQAQERISTNTDNLVIPEPGVSTTSDIAAFVSDFDALEMDTYGEMYRQYQELAEQLLQVEEVVEDVILFAQQSNEAIEQQRQMLGTVRDELMWSRMLPLAQIFNRFPRVLRDLSAQHNKPAELIVLGARILVDKAALDKLYNPLLHLIRNAFDHGVESPAERAAAGKPAVGQIWLRAYHQGNRTYIEVQDDGHGLDYKRIGEKAIAKSIISASQLDYMPRSQLLDFIFEPGFSTQEQVSELSGRGVGLDVVRSELNALKGDITVNSEPGQGTTFTLQLPLTLTLAKLLTCTVGNFIYAFPSDSIADILVPRPEQLSVEDGQTVLRWQDRSVPVTTLDELLVYQGRQPDSLPTKALGLMPAPSDWCKPLLIFRRGARLNAIQVDRLASEQELVVKPFSPVIAAPTYTYGCTVLGDGSLVPVINANILLAEDDAGNLRSQDRIARDNSSASWKATAPTVLIIDDSAALRGSLALTLGKAGYRVLQARDGRDGLDKLEQSSQIRFVLCDIEMPIMNGFEFLAQRRQEATLKAIPVGMLTSRSNDKHRQLCLRLGANAYFTKPYIESEFLKEIAQLINLVPRSI